MLNIYLYKPENEIDSEIFNNLEKFTNDQIKELFEEEIEFPNNKGITNKINNTEIENLIK